ncbi:PAS domain-containing protein [Azospirillum sp.]|uniref:PAS domain-containing protein n=1 Tax=Azospirillum sp. TaxID=34012 RepID=UPI003D7603E5
MGGTWRAVVLGLAVVGLALVWLANEVVRRAGDDRGTFILAVAAAGFGVLALWWVFSRLVRHFRDLERLASDLAALRHRGDLPADWQARSGEVGQVAAALAELLHRERRTGGAGGRLATVAAALEEPVVVLSDLGRITLLNPAAARLFGPGVAVGMDVYDVLDRPELFRAIERARGAGQPVSATVRGPGGAELPAQVVDFGLQAGVALVFPFHPAAQPLLPVRPSVAAPAAAPTIGEDEPLAALPMVALSVDLAEGRVVGVGTVRLSGARVFRTVSLDVPVNPGEPVPGGARPFAAAWPVIAEALHHAVVVGVDVDAALGALRMEMERAGLPPMEDPPALDLRRLATTLDPTNAAKDLAALAAQVGVVPHPGAPHALLAAELAAALLRRLDERGVTTLGEARALEGGAAPALPLPLPPG